MINKIYFLTFFLTVSNCGKKINNNSKLKDQQKLLQTTSCQCSLDEKYVCGKDNITYINDCVLNCYEIKIEVQGKCPAPLNSTICLAEFNEVCGFNGITYSNECLANKHGVKNYKTGPCH